jgi:hypothetical protein
LRRKKQHTMKKPSLSPLKLLFAVLLLVSFSPAFSATVKGHLRDGVSKENLTGATVYLKENNQINAVAGLDGSFLLKNVQPGTYTLVAEVFSYKTMEKTITIQNAADEITQDFDMQPDSTTLHEVQVVGAYAQGSDNYARTEEKKSDVIMNIMSAKTIQLLPDLTIGDVLQRVSGVTTAKSVTGGGKYATIRGMDARYNYTTIDGVKVPSPDYKNSYVPMDIFPSEMVERLEVIKTLTPDMEGDAIGGAMNLVLKEAPDNFTLSAEAATGFNENLVNHGFQTFNTSVINSQSPNQINGPDYGANSSNFPVGATTLKEVPVPANTFSGFTIGDRFFGGKFGVLVSFNYQNTYNYTTGFFIKPQSQPNASLTAFNIPDWDEIESREYYVQQTRGAGHVMLDYAFNKKNKITLYNVYAQMVQTETRLDDDTLNPTPNSELNPSDRFEVTYEHIYNVTLKGTDTLAHNLALDWTTAYSKAWSVIPDWNDLSLSGNVSDPSNIQFSGLTTRWIDNTEQDYSGYINLTYSLNLFGQDIELKTGAMNRDKSRNAYYAEYDFNSAPPPNQQQYTGMSEIFSNHNYYSFADTTGTPGSANSYAVQQDINAYYGLIKFSVGPRIDILGGERIENTNEAYQTQESDVIPAAYGSKQYTDGLPSIEIKFKITDKQSVQASFFESITRPSLFDIVPYQIPGDYYSEIGNPSLLHTQANNYDLRYEFFPSASEEILAGVFYKQIYNAIENAITRGSGGPSATYLQPTNIGGDTNPAINYGFEFQFIKYIHNFGVSANYTYTHSSITVPEQEYYENASGFHTAYINETRPLQGQANDIANLSLLYRSEKLGFEAQLSAVYTGKEISAVNIWYDMDQWQMPMTTLAFSFEKRLSKKINLSLYGKINNILNTPLLIEMFPPSQFKNDPIGASEQNWLPDQSVSNGYLSSIIMEKELYGQSYLMGLRYKF